MGLEPVVVLHHLGCVFTFRVYPRHATPCWLVECDGHTYHTTVRVTGLETPRTFRGIAAVYYVLGDDGTPAA
jgi:hypothetical protein